MAPGPTTDRPQIAKTGFPIMHEYKVVPAPGRAVKVRGLKTTGERFAHTVTEVLNDLGAEGWEFLRSETLPCEERKGWFGGTRTSTQIVLVFRRPLPDARALAAEPVLRRPGVEAGEGAAPLALRASPPAPPLTTAPPLSGAQSQPGSGPEGRDPLRADPVFRPGAMHRTEGERRFPPLRHEGDASAAKDGNDSRT
jgi:hypothetical protein